MSADCTCGDTATAGQDAPPCGVRILRAADYRRMRWKNGAGWTTEVLRMPEREDWDWRLSLAEIDQDAPFSAFPGMERLLVLLQGDGLRLQFEDGRTQELRPPHGMLRFSGDRPLRAELLGGPCRDFGLIWKRGRIDVQLWHRPLAGTMVLFAGRRETWLLHLLEGTAQVAGDGVPGGALVAGDSVLLEGSELPTRLPLEGHGAALLARITRIGED